MTDLDYLQLFELVIDELLVKASEDISRFSYNDSGEDEGISRLFGLFDRNTRGRSREIHWESNQHQDCELIITVNFADGTMFIQMPDEDEGIEVDIGHGVANGSLKKKFMRLYRQVEEYVNVQLEEENLSNFYDSVQKTFPSIMDRFILEIQDDEEDGDS